MRILVVGGTGMIGGHAALYLREQGHEVAIAARKPPAAPPLAELALRLFDYVEDEIAEGDLAGFDALVFAAGHDIRHMPRDQDGDTYWERVNSVAIPRFFARARDAGIRTAVYVGSFYPQVAPALIGSNAYVRSRHRADEGVRALATDAFRVCSVNAPFVVGTVPGLANPMFEAYTRYAQGKLEGIPVFGPAGGTNFISTQSLSEAIAGALERGESGTAYLVGDENLRFAEYFAAFFRAAGNPATVPELDQAHPLLPDAAILAGRGSMLAYEPDADETALLGYRRGDIQRAVNEIVAQFAS